MKSILSILAATALIAPGAIAQEVSTQPAPAPGVHPIARLFFGPIVALTEIQAELSPEKASCWNDRASEVVGCKAISEK